MAKIAVLAYSGGLDTSCAIAWLKEDYGFDEVVAVLVDVGQAFDVDAAIERGKAAGADAVPQLAEELGAEAVVHGCTGKGNDQLRFELAFKANYPGVKVIAPLRDRIWTRDAEIAYAAERGIPVEAKAESPYSVDDNLFGRAIEAGILEDPWTAPPEEAFLLTADPAEAPASTDVVVSFEEGLPIAID